MRTKNRFVLEGTKSMSQKCPIRREFSVATNVTIDPGQATAFIRKLGPLDPGELREGIQNLISDPNFGDVTNLHIDTRKADLQNFVYTEIHNYVEQCDAVLKDFRIVIVVSSDLAFGVAKMIEALSDIENVLITRDASLASAWLGVHS